MTLKSLAMIVALSFSALGQDAPQVLTGSWTATSGPKQVFRGSWSATVLSSTPNAAQGSWTLANASNLVVLEGTWSAEKSARGWQGAWAARILPNRRDPRGSSAGKVVTGTWQASLKDPSIKSLVEMLRRTLTEEISGSWRSGGHRGNWWLKGTGQAAP